MLAIGQYFKALFICSVFIQINLTLNIGSRNNGSDLIFLIKGDVPNLLTLYELSQSKSDYFTRIVIEVY